MLHNNSSHSTGLLQKITSFLMGVFASFFIFLIVIKIFTSFNQPFLGQISGTFFNIVGGIMIMKKYGKKPEQRIIGLGMVSTSITILVLTLVVWGLLSSVLK